MSALSTRDALIPVAHSHTFVVDSTAYGQEACGCGWKRDGFDAPTHEEHLLDALLTSGAVLDAATLADDEAAIEVMARDAFNRAYRNATWATASWDSQARWLAEYRHAVRALTAALAERGRGESQ